jgi:hypothetical protein
MWFITLILAVLFGIWLGEKEQPISNWIIAYIAALLLGWIFGLIIPALLPTLATYAVAADQLVYVYAVTDLIGLVLGLVTIKIKQAIIK